MKSIGWIGALILTSLLSACLSPPAPDPASTAIPPFVIHPEENPYAETPEDLGKQQASVVVTSVNLIERLDLAPVRAELGVSGSMPGSCHELRIKVEPPDASYQIFIEVYSVFDPNLNCENVFQQFEARILLGEYTPGRYVIFVNGAIAGDMVSY